jgi:hypothetical protein
MATSLSLENDSSLAQGYLKVNGSTAATLTTSGITGNLVGNVTGNADTSTKFSTTTGSAPAYACRAWVNFDGTRDTTGAVSTANTNRLIRSSGNVTSVLRNAAGQYTVSFTTPMTDANYTLTGTAQLFNPGTPSGWVTLHNLGVPATNSCQVGSGAGVSNQDAAFINVAIFGN